MLKVYDPSEFENEDGVPPECRATVDSLQRALDGEIGFASFEADADAHAVVCPACRERVRAARVLLSMLAAPREPVTIPPEFADRVVSSIQMDRRVQIRRTAYKVTALVAVAAAVLIAVFVLMDRTPNEIAKQPELETVPPPPVEKDKPAPAPIPAPSPDARPIRINDELANATQTILEAPKPLSDSVAVAPKLWEALTNAFKLTVMPDPMGNSLEPARKSLTELPVAARSSLEPVTDTAEKAFKRFLTDVGAVKPNS